jgi:hypothetical protein
MDSERHHDNAIENSGVLLNAHFDTVSTSGGATDDGISIVSILQLVSYFTLPQNQPRNGVVALLNNNEEEGQWGSKTFSKHPLRMICGKFLNLEGAGAGGRAVVSRASDVEGIAAYKDAPNPFGGAITSESFNLGFAKGTSDYSVLSKDLDMKGLEITFYHTRSRHHTMDDDTQHTSVNSMWHMLSNSLPVVQVLSGSPGETPMNSTEPESV